jgi:predicted MFS family arabinose efflux permease
VPQPTATNPSAPTSLRPLLLALAFAVFTAAAGTHAITPLFPELKQLLGTSDDAVRALTSVYTIGYSFSGFALGLAIDRRGRRPVLLAALLVFAVANAFAFAAEGYAALFALRLLAGFAAGGIGAAALALTADAVPYARRGAAMSLVTAGAYAASVLGMPLASQLAHFRLGAIFAALAIIASVSAVVVAAVAPRAAPGTPADTSAPDARLFAVIGSKAVRGALLATFGVTCAAFAVVTSLADHAVDRFQADHGARSVLFLLLGLGSLAGAFAAHRFADRRGKPLVLRVALYGSLVTLPLLLLPATRTGFALAAVLVAAFAGARQGPFVALLTELRPSRERGRLLGFNSLASGLGLALGTFAGGLGYAAAGLGGAVGVAAAGLLVAIVAFELRIARADVVAQAEARARGDVDGLEQA